MKGVLKTQFNYSINQFSPVVKELGFKIEYDEDGRELVTFPEIDLREVTKSLGTVEDWNLKNLLAAGVNPENIRVSTSFPTRIECFDGVAEFIGALDSVNSDSNIDNSKTE